MKIQMNIAYTESYIPPRCRKPRNRVVEDKIITTLRETTKMAAPVAFVVHDYERYLEMTDIEVRHFKGKLYRKRYNFDEVCLNGTEPAPYTVEDLVKKLERRPDYYPYESREESIESARSRAREYLLIDGEVWHVCGEPMYVIQTFGLGFNHASTSLSVAWHYNPNLASSAYFSAMEKERAIKEAVDTALGRGDTNSVERIRNPIIDIKVLMPEAVKRKPKKDRQ